MNPVINIVIIDDHKLARQGMREIVTLDQRFHIIGEGRNGHDALQLAESLQPHMMLIDIEMPGMDGLEATRLIKTHHPAIKIVIVTVSDDVSNLFEAIKRGAQGYLLKNLQPASWLEYLQAIAEDEMPMSKQLAGKMIAEFSSMHAKSHQDERHSPLTEREREILEWVAKGKTNREISEALYISENTVKNHLKNILQKLHMQNRVQLTHYAIKMNFL
jgi:DNA-binding NarL/FixJ family response regulator